MERMARLRWVFLTAQSGPRQAALILTALMALTASVVVSMYVAGYDVVSAMRDAKLSNAPAAGVISNTGIAVMAAGACAALAGAYREGRWSLFLLGLFCLIFVADDALMFHERLGPWEVLVFGFFGLMAGGIIYAFWKEQTRLPWPMLIGAGAFALSAVIDTFWGIAVEFVIAAEMTRFLRFLGLIVEDLPKLGGIGVVALFALGESFQARRTPAAALNAQTP